MKKEFPLRGKITEIRERNFIHDLRQLFVSAPPYYVLTISDKEEITRLLYFEKRDNRILEKLVSDFFDKKELFIEARILNNRHLKGIIKVGDQTKYALKSTYMKIRAVNNVQPLLIESLEIAYIPNYKD